jgi:hypothetical protein
VANFAFTDRGLSVNGFPLPDVLGYDITYFRDGFGECYDPVTGEIGPAGPVAGEIVVRFRIDDVEGSDVPDAPGKIAPELPIPSPAPAPQKTRWDHVAEAARKIAEGGQ